MDFQIPLFSVLKSTALQQFWPLIERIWKSVSQSSSLILVRHLGLRTTWTFLKFFVPCLGFQFSPSEFLLCHHSWSSLLFTDTSSLPLPALVLPPILALYPLIPGNISPSFWNLPNLMSSANYRGSTLISSQIPKRISHFLFLAYILGP